MNKDQFFQQIQQVFDEGFELIKKKNADYTGKRKSPFANFEEATIVGIMPEQAVLARMLEKISRVGSLLKQEQQVKDEPVHDTLVDIMNLAAILDVYVASKKDAPASKGGGK